MIYFSPFQQIQNRTHTPQVFCQNKHYFSNVLTSMKTSGKLKQTLSLVGLHGGGWVLASAFISQSHHAAALVSPFLHPLLHLVCILQPQRSQDCPDTSSHWGWFDRGTWFSLSFWRLHFSSGWINTTCRPSHWAPESTGTVVKLKYHLSCCIYRNSCFQGLSFS